MNMSVSTNASALRPCAYLVSNKSCRCRPCERISQFGQAINALVNVCIRTRTGKCQHKYNPNAFELKMKRPRRPHQIQQSAWGVRSCEWLLDATRQILAVTQEPHPFLRSSTSTLMRNSKGDYNHGS